MSEKKLKGCELCKHLDYYEKDGYEDSSPEGYFCNYRDDNGLNLKTFPAKRKLKCFEEEQKGCEKP